MSDPRELLDAYAAAIYDAMSDRLDEIAPQPLAALRAVLDVHVRAGGRALPAFCLDDEQDWPCATVQAITSALEGT